MSLFSNVLAGVRAVVAPAPPKRPIDPFYSDLARRAEVNARSARDGHPRWIDVRPDWLHERRRIE